MRLLERKPRSENENEFEFVLTTEYVNDIDTPAYAILSHRWGADTEEVSFKDLKDGTGQSKKGYKKIQFCGEQARRDGLQYFWVDTCCIDKSNNNELSEAINSMFRWYRNAAKCYVYLSDVPRAVNIDDESPKLLALAFRNSKWFTRGWTLQELIAPPSVKFFSSDKKLLGDKKSLERDICGITKIPATVLQGNPLSGVSIRERMSWVENRNTTREEDKAYSLLGIFNVYIPLLYGEGRENAFVRLRQAIDAKERDHLSSPQTTSIESLPPPSPQTTSIEALPPPRQVTQKHPLGTRPIPSRFQTIRNEAGIIIKKAERLGDEEAIILRDAMVYPLTWNDRTTVPFSVFQWDVCCILDKKPLATTHPSYFSGSAASTGVEYLVLVRGHRVFIDSRLLSTTIPTPVKQNEVVGLCEMCVSVDGYYPKGTVYKLVRVVEGTCYVKQPTTGERFSAPQEHFTA